MIEFFDRPYSYRREPFRLDPGELVTYHGDIFSVPGSGALLEKRLFTPSSSHPVNSTIRVYVNKDSNTSFLVEPDQTATHYESGTPHYAEVITDIRDTLDEVFTLTANDSDWSDCDFKAAHLNRVRSDYNLDNTRASGLPGQCLYVHPAPQNDVPTEDELGFLGGFQDIDIDEIQYQPPTRPKKFRALNPSIENKAFPIEPIFPAVIKTDGSLPSFSSRDNSYFDLQGLDAQTSGNAFLITGDNLVTGTRVRLFAASGGVAQASSSFLQSVNDAEYPGSSELESYYTAASSSGSVVAIGRRALYNQPNSSITQGVYILNVSDASSSGVNINHWPSNYLSTSGITPGPIVSGIVNQTLSKTHNGIHVTDKLIYQINSIGSAGQLVLARSPINGKAIFAHIGPTETNSQGNAVGFSYNVGDTLYSVGRVNDAFIGGSASLLEFDTTSAPTFGTASSITASTTQLRGLAAINAYIIRPERTQFNRNDSIATDDGITTIKTYAEAGTVDQVVLGDTPTAGGGQLTTFVISTVSRTYIVNPITGNRTLVDTRTTTTTGDFFENTFNAEGLFTNFYFRRPNNRLQNVNGNAYFQFTTGFINNVAQGPINSAFVRIPSTGTTKLFPENPRRVSTYVIGFFPIWTVRVVISVSTQVELPDKINVSPTVRSEIDFSSDLQNFITRDNVAIFGPPIWDADNSVNYLYFQTKPGLNGNGNTAVYFAKMDTNFTINEINLVNSEDAILTGKAALLSV